MGFTQGTIDLEQVTGGIFKTQSDLDYFTKAGEHIRVTKGYVTDGYSKPRLTEIIVGGRYEDDLRPAVLHDYLCQNKGYYEPDTNNYIPLKFKKVNDLFYEAMISVGIGRLKALLMRFAVNFNPSRW